MASIVIGYTMEGGKLAALAQIAEFIVIGGAGISSLIAATSFKRVTAIIKDCIALLKSDPYGRTAYVELLQLLHETSNLARRDGLLALESHVENPETSDLITRYPRAIALNPSQYPGKEIVVPSGLVYLSPNADFL